MPKSLMTRVKKTFPGTTWVSQQGNLIISDYQVMQSAAGFYIGQSCVEEMEDGYLLPQPFDRCSHYMSKEEAEKYLESFKD